MNNDYDADLRRLFAKMPEPAEGEIFTERVSRRMARHRWAHRVIQILLAGLGVVILAALTPWLMSLTGHIALGSDFLANCVLAVILSPAGWAIGGWLGLLVFLKARLFSDGIDLTV